jgi:hypothetical protein
MLLNATTVVKQERRKTRGDSRENRGALAATVRPLAYKA